MSTEASAATPVAPPLAVSAARMPLRLRLGWWLLATLVVLLVLCTAAHAVASTTASARLPLVVGAGTSLKVYRLLPDSPRLSLAIARRGRGGDAVQSALVRLRIAHATASELQEALPRSAWSRELLWRMLVPVRDGAIARRAASRILLPIGRSPLEITVLAVDPALHGETVTISVEPPLGFKQADPRLGWLWWFYFWPVYAALLAVFAGVLAWRTSRWQPYAGAFDPAPAPAE